MNEERRAFVFIFCCSAKLSHSADFQLRKIATNRATKEAKSEYVSLEWTAAELPPNEP